MSVMSQKIISIVGKTIFRFVPRRRPLLFRFCRRYVDRYRGDNNIDMQSNGEVALLRAALPSAKMVFDVGANRGEWSEAAVRIQPAATYHSFEPSAFTFRLLQSAHLPPNVILNNAGIGAKAGSLELCIFAEGLGANSLYDRRGTDAQTIRRESVTITTIDDYCAANSIDRIDFLKLDIEGHEFPALQGARRMLQSGSIRIIQFEYGGTYIDARVLLRDVWDYIDSLSAGYAFYKIAEDGLLSFREYRQEYESLVYSNWVIMTPETARQLPIRIINWVRI